MKRKLKALSLILTVILALSLLLSSCEIKRMKEYNGKELVKLTYETVVYNGGFTETNVLDFVKNEYRFTEFDPYADEEEMNGNDFSSEFSEDEERAFLNACYTYGLFDILPSYEIDADDGGGWVLEIEYEDGTKKRSEGRNDAPYVVFNNCATAFFDLCGHVVLGTLPLYYATPPRISYSLSYSIDDKHLVTGNSFINVKPASYKWNGHEYTDFDIFAINESTRDKNNLSAEYDYKLVLYTSNYDCKERFSKITVTEYDYNAELSDGRVIYSGGWIKQEEMDISLNKIYVYELTFRDGDYAQFTFNTYCEK